MSSLAMDLAVYAESSPEGVQWLPLLHFYTEKSTEALEKHNTKTDNRIISINIQSCFVLLQQPRHFVHLASLKHSTVNADKHGCTMHITRFTCVSWYTSQHFTHLLVTWRQNHVEIPLTVQTFRSWSILRGAQGTKVYVTWKKQLFLLFFLFII